jgi:uncharacterized protein
LRQSRANINVPTIEEAKSWYPSDDPVHGYDHILRVYRLAEWLGEAAGADLRILRAAALLHDIQTTGEGEKSTGGEGSLHPDTHAEAKERGEHHQRSAYLATEILRAEEWEEEQIAAVVHCIQAHRFRDESNIPETLEAKVLFDADKLDAIGAIGAARAMAYTTQNGQPFYAPPSKLFLETGELEPGEPHSAYHEFQFKLIKIKARLFTEPARQLAESRQRRMIDFFEGLVEEIEGK